MLFHTFTFIVFFLILVVILSKTKQFVLRKIVLLCASYVFYMWWNPAFILLILFSTAVNYFAGLMMEKVHHAGARRIYLILGMAANIGILAFFKYANFIQENILGLFSLFGYTPHWSTLRILLPVGISFYTFQSMSYTIDVYRGKLKTCHSFLDFALYISFFPQLVAGPIVRASDFIHQLKTPQAMCFDRRALFLFLRGLTKKVIIANNIAFFADFVFEAPRQYGSFVIWIATITFYVQIYCDFSGYSDMAIALARMLGYYLPINFRRPYFAVNPADFWRRWHISLSTWLRDYLYIPLGGNRKGTFLTYRNLMVTMLLGGLWHGASWNYVLWGALHGIALIGHRLYQTFVSCHFDRSIKENPAYKILCFVLMQYWILLTWIPFRVLNTEEMLYSLKKFVLFDVDFSVVNQGMGGAQLFSTVMILISFYGLHLFSHFRRGLDVWLCVLNMKVVCVLCMLMGFVCFLLWPSNEIPFIYFQF